MAKECPLTFSDDAKHIRVEYEKQKRINQFDNKLVALSNTLAKKQTKWTLTEKKLFFLTISQLHWNKGDNSNVVELQKHDVYEKLGLNPDNLEGGYLRKHFKSMVLKSLIEFGDDEEFDDNVLFTGYSARGNTVKVTINTVFMPMVQALSSRYTTLWLDDLLEFESKHSMMLYQTLRRLFVDTKAWSQPIDFTTMQLKEIFGLSQSDYMIKSTGKFNRTEFEKKCIQKAVDEINSKCQAMRIEEWFKDKNRGKVDKYVFQVACKTREYSKIKGGK